MASTAADIIASAKAEAEAARQSAMASLSGLGNNLTNAYNAQQSATTANYQNQLNQLQNAYQTNSKQAYGNYMDARQNLSNQMTRLGLTDTGYGVSQGLLAQASYSKNLAGLQNAYQTNQANLGVAEQQALADLYSNYAKNRLNIDQYVYEAGKNAYDRAYANSYQAQQDALSYALQLQQLAARSYGGGSSGGSGGSSGGSKSTKSSSEPTLTAQNQTQTAQAKQSNNAKQVKGITQAGKDLAKRLRSMVTLLKDKNTAALEIQNQYNAGNITAEDVRYITGQLGLK